MVSRLGRVPRQAEGASAAAHEAVRRAPVARRAPAKAVTPEVSADGAKPVVAKRTARAPSSNGIGGRAAPAKKAAPAQQSADLSAVHEWTPQELVAVREELKAELADLQHDYDSTLAELDDLQQAGNDGAGDDQADAGSKTFEREQEQSIAANRLDLIIQTQRAIERIDRGTYGLCESCGKPIPKARLQYQPSATMDVICKAREERR
jgi:RNA polymerase-binding transcription factor DksA